MADGFSGTVDASAVLAALAQFGDKALLRTKPACKVSADHIAHEAAARVKRRTGETAKGIQVAENHKGDGYVVFVHNTRMPGLPGWIEGGTSRGKPGSHTQAPAPFLYPAATLEQGAHERRIADALQDTADAEGLGGR